jgi:CheY-like chemotaxis protein
VRDQKHKKKFHTVLLVEDEVLVRMPIAGYLRDCGYRVIEAADGEEAIVVLSSDELNVDIVFTAAELNEKMDGFALSQWIRSNQPHIMVVLAGTPKRIASLAGELCEEGPMLRKPYSVATIEGYIRNLLATKPDTPRSD